MTRRPPMPPDGNIRRAHQRMAPGGRLWSESPVRGPAVRVVAAGDDPPAGYVTYGTATDDRSIYWSSYGTREAGDLLIAMAAVRGVAVTAPPGWTDLATGNVGGCYYSLSYTRSVGAPGGGIEGVFGGAPTGEQVPILGWALRTTATPLIVYGDTGTTAATRCAFGTPSGLLPVQIIAAASTGGGTLLGSTTDPDYSSLDRTAFNTHGELLVSTWPLNPDDVDSGPFPGAADSVMTLSSDFASFVVAL